MVYVFLADGFETIEALAPVDIMRRAGIDVVTVSLNKTTAVKSAQNVIIEADTTTAKLPSPEKIIGEFQGIVLPGGMPGALNLDEDKTVDLFINFALITKKVIGAICAAPFILGKRGVLEGKKAVCYPGFEDKLEGATVLDDTGIVVEGNIVTAKAMGMSIEFGLTLARIIRDYNTSEKIRDSIFYKI